MKVNVLVTQLNNHVLLPEYKTEFAACMDLYANLTTENDIREIKLGSKYKQDNDGKVLLKPTGRVLIPTGIKVAIPEGFKMTVKPRSGLTIHDGIVAILGTIDSDYRGEIGIIIYNHSDTVFVIKNNDRLAQLELEQIIFCEWEIVKKLPETQRGEGGFGHTGK